MKCLLVPVALVAIFSYSCGGQARAQTDAVRDASSAVAGLEVAEDLEVQLIASEPMLLSPSNIDVDHLGRIWVCEVVNYRHFANKNNPPREAGDRILVLEDTTGDGLMDKSTTFYQGRDIDSPHGVCVLGNRVIVSAGSSVFDFYDDDGDLKADRKEVLFSGIKGAQHDHGIHSFLFGPDARLYFNFGNEGKELHRPDGSIVTDIAGNEVRATRNPYQQGMAFRCEPDGSRVDTIGWNFRNNWELCVDSFGTVWQSDNDDDGNRGVRINYVMEYGNYGYRDEITGAGWREPRTNMHADIPRRHWHLNDPGVIPNLLQTGAGSPTGITCYEGDLLPKRFHNQLIHCDAGPNVVRSYAVTPDGAGYKAEINDILSAKTDRWFRPSDVCVAPDGSLIVADWYDPGVGGHRQGDIDRGRLFRIAPTNSPYHVVAPDLTTTEGAVTALRSPNVATRYLACQTLLSLGAAAETALNQMFTSDRNPRYRARALWLLGQIPGRTQHYVDTAAADANSDIRLTALRLARRMQTDVSPLVAQLAQDSAVAVRRECALALRHVRTPAAVAAWAELASRMPADDRWYLEALGIAADDRWDACLAALKDRKISSANLGHLVWRSRSKQTSQHLNKLITATAAAATEVSGPGLLSLFRAFDFQPQDTVTGQVSGLLKPDTLKSFASPHRTTVVAEALQRLGKSGLESNADARAALSSVLSDLQGTSEFVTLVQRFQIEDRYPEVLALAQTHPDEQLGVDAIGALLRVKSWRTLSLGLRSADTQAGVATAQALGNTRDERTAKFLLRLLAEGNLSTDVRREIVRNASKVNGIASGLAEMYRQQKLSPELHQTLAAALHGASSRNSRELAGQLFPLPPVKEGKPLLAISELIKMQGDVKNGRLIFNTTGTCHKCHVVNKIGRDIGPDLSEIGSKLSRQAMFESIIFPSAGISHNYEAYTLVFTSGTTASGLIVSETDSEISLKGDDGLIRKFAVADIDEKVKQKISLMPADLQKVMSVQEMVDVVEYALTLKKK